ncbi:hypothetical protein K438DRAFT_1616672, partial [Mycena galopus ATCC 62051]
MDDDDDVESKEEEVSLVISENYVGASAHLIEYPLRSEDAVFDRLCLWEHEEWVTKVSAASEGRRLERLENEEARRVTAEHRSGWDGRKGPTALPRGKLHRDHPQTVTHLARMRRVPVVNVLLGPSIPRPDRGPEEKERWCRTMLVLFKPWRSVKDLRKPNETWSDAFDCTTFSAYAHQVMRNMRVEDECKDARDVYDDLRK